MVKKLLTVTFALTMLSGMAAWAAPDDFMTFEDAEGQLRSISTKGLKITLSADKMFAGNGTEAVEMPLQSLKGIYFSETSAVASLAADRAAQKVTAYNTQGVLAGEFASVDDAVAKLPAGTYVITTESQTFKIAVK